MNREISNPVIKEILASKAVITSSGSKVQLVGGIDANEGALIASLIERYKPSRTIEIGCAYGISSLFICDALKRANPAGHHTIIDPHQSTLYQGGGLTALKRAGLDDFTLIEERSQFTLPELVRQRLSYDFALIDGYHTFDATLNDFFYLNCLCPVNSIILFDDVGFEPVNRAVRYVLNYPAYRVLAHVNPPGRSVWKRAGFATAEVAASLTSLLGPAASNFVFNQRFLMSDRRLGIDGSMVAVQKVTADERPWDWFKPF